MRDVFPHCAEEESVAKRLVTHRASKWLNGNLNADLSVFKPVFLFTMLYHQLASSTQSRLIIFQMKTHRMDDRWDHSLPLGPNMVWKEPFLSLAKQNWRLPIKLQKSFF